MARQRTLHGMHPNAVVLSAGGMRCVLRPDLGGCIAGLWLDGEPVLRSAEAIRSARESANFPLVPFSNRIADARLDWLGESHRLERNFAPEPHAMHGIGWQREWTLLRSDAASAQARLVHTGDAHWPFDFVCKQEFSLEPHALHLSLTLTNSGKLTSPAGLGWHPYVVKRPGASVQFAAAARWETDSRGLPVGRSVVDGLVAPCDTLAVNHAYDGVVGAVVVQDAVLHVGIASTLSRLVAFTNPAKDFIGLEPVSHVPDSFNRADRSMGTVALQTGGSMTARMTIEARRPS